MPIMDPVVSRNIRLAAQNNLVGGTFWDIDVDTFMRNNWGLGVLNADGSYRFDITLYAVWLEDEVWVTYESGSGTGNSRVQTGYLFEGTGRAEIGGDNAWTVSHTGTPYSVTGDVRTFGLMVFDDTGFEKPGYNFLGWRPVLPAGEYMTGALNRIFFPGEFLPSVRQNFRMVAQWVEHNDENSLETIDGRTVLSIDPTHDFVADPIITNAQVVLVPRGIGVLPRGAITANNAQQINLPTYLERVTVSGSDCVITDPENGLQIEQGAIISTSLRWLFINDSLRGMSDEFVPNIVAGEIQFNTATRAHESISNFRAYVVAQGNTRLLLDDSGPGNREVTGVRAFVGQTEKYRYELTAGTWGILYTSTDSGAARELIAFPSARAGAGAGGTIGGIELAGVSIFRPYAFAYINNASTIQMSASHTGVPITEISERVLFHSMITNLVLPTSVDNTHPYFLTGYHPHLATVTFGVANSNTSSWANVQNGILWYGENRLVYVLNNSSNTTFTLQDIGSEKTINTFGLYNLTRMNLASLQIDSHLAVGQTLRYAHFAANLPQSLNSIRATTSLRGFEWEIVNHLNLSNGLHIGGNAVLPITGMSTNHGAGAHNRFPIFVPATQMSAYMAAHPGRFDARVEGNSRFQVEEKTLLLCRGQVASGETALEQLVTQYGGNDLRFGMTITMPSMPSNFQREGMAFVGWQVEVSGYQVHYHTENLRFRAGERVQIGMIYRNATQTQDGSIYIQDQLRIVALWEEILVTFVYRHQTDTGISDFEERTFTGNDLRVFMEGNPGEIESTPVTLYDERLSRAWNEMAANDEAFFLPGSNHSFTVGTGVTSQRYQFVGWTTVSPSTNTNDLDGWLWTEFHRESNPTMNMSTGMVGTNQLRWLPEGTVDSLIEIDMTVNNGELRFYALYDRASANISYVYNTHNVRAERDTGNQPGFSVRRNYSIPFDANMGISIPAAAMDANNNSFMRRVTQIADRGFWYPFNRVPEELEPFVTGEIYIGENVRHIGRQAFERTNANRLTFAYNYYLVSPELIGGLVIGSNAFAYNYLLAGVNVYQGGGIYANILQLPGNTTEIGVRSFLENSSIEWMRLSHSQHRLRYIHAQAFENTYNMTSFFSLPATVMEIDASAFSLSGIKEFNAAGQTAGGYDVIGGNIVRISGPNTILVKYAPGSGSGTLPEDDYIIDVATLGVTRIGDRAFAGNRYVTHIIIPGTIRVGHAAFANSFDLISIQVNAATPTDFQHLAIDLNHNNAFYRVSSGVRISVPGSVGIWETAFGINQFD